MRPIKKDSRRWYRQRFEGALGLLIRLKEENKVTPEGLNDINEALEFWGLLNAQPNQTKT